MAESSLSQGYPDIARRVAKYLGYPSSSASWSSEETEDINDALDSGLRCFYFPEEVGGIRSHTWSFLRPTTTLATVAGTGDYNLPDDFGNIYGNLTFAAADQGVVPVQIVGEGEIRRLRQGNTQVEQFPTKAAVRPKVAGAGVAGQRWEILLWPTPDAVYTLSYQYDVLPNYIRTGTPYPWGGAAHAETILMSCLAAAELHNNDVDGPMRARFLARLVASIKKDRKLQPHFLGKNLDSSDVGAIGNLPTRNGQVTFNSTLY